MILEKSNKKNPCFEYIFIVHETRVPDYSHIPHIPYSTVRLHRDKSKQKLNCCYLICMLRACYNYNSTTSKCFLNDIIAVLTILFGFCYILCSNAFWLSGFQFKISNEAVRRLNWFFILHCKVHEHGFK